MSRAILSYIYTYTNAHSIKCKYLYIYRIHKVFVLFLECTEKH